MPNWSSVHYTITGKEDVVSDLYEKICTLEKMEKPLVENGFGNLWLGCIVKALGGDPEVIRCRGSVEFYDYNNGVLHVEMECAWCELQDFRHFIESATGCDKIIYDSQEPNMCEYCTNDPGIVGKYHFEIYVHEGDSFFEESVSEKRVIDAVNKFLGTSYDTIEDVVKAADDFNAESDDDYISIVKYKHIE